MEFGEWVTAYARNNLLKNVIKLDEFAVYMDTDSIKLRPGYDKNVIFDYNKFVERKIAFVSETLKIPIEKFAPADIHGTQRMLGVFDDDGHYKRFITQGAKKYAFEKIGKDGNVQLKITVAGVPKSGAKALKRLEDFKDNFVFTFEDTNKNLLMYCENQREFELVDYLGQQEKVTDKSGCCLMPTTYVLSKALEYANLINDNSSNRAIYKEEG